MKQTSIILACTISTSIIGADTPVDNSPTLRRAGPPVRQPQLSTVQITYPIAEQIVKDAIRTHTIPVIRQRLQDEIVAFHKKSVCAVDDKDKQFHFLFTKSFSASSQGQLSRTVFDLVAKNESQPSFRAEAKDVYVAELGSIITEMATPKKVDGITDYTWITDEHGQKGVECITSIMDLKFLEKMIEEVEREL